MGAVFVLVFWLTGGGGPTPRAVYGPFGTEADCITAGNAKVASLVKSKHKSEWEGHVHFVCLQAKSPADLSNDLWPKS
jgi:hypothetical protein